MRRALFLLLSLCVYSGVVWSGQESRQSTYTITKSGTIVPGTVKEKTQPAQPLTNESIIKLVRARLGDDTIVGIVNTQPGRYSLGADDIIALKKAGVSDKILTAILNKSAIPPTSSSPAAATPEGAVEKPDAAESLDPGPKGRPFSVRTTSSTPLPEYPGLFYVDEGRCQAIIGQAVLFRRTGSRLAGALTAGIVSGKVNIKIPGKNATVRLGGIPTFYYHPGPGDPPGVLTLVLARLKEANGKRQLEARAAGAWRASEGVSINSQIQLATTAASADVYKVAPQDELKAGEYAFYLRTAGASTQDAFLYTFSVQ